MLVNRLGASGNALAIELHRSNSQIHGVMTGKTRPRVDLLEDLARMYPQINMDWLINGRGGMWMADQEGGMGVAEKPPPQKLQAAEAQSPYQSASESYYREKYIAAQEKIAQLYETIVELQKKGARNNAG